MTHPFTLLTVSGLMKVSNQLENIENDLVTRAEVIISNMQDNSSDDGIQSLRKLVGDIEFIQDLKLQVDRDLTLVD